MQLILEVKDNKSDFVLELLKSFSFIKIRSMSAKKSQLLKEIEQAVEEIKQIQQGKLTPKPVEEFLNEL